ncbi:MAG: hypothetical protein JO182_28145 [Acidobacteriaceae bacterium]|nr:hypothetical protein [Acidobacteriaceae bacterium]MBV9225056.1 hypothetical protein [Acidobacteriaceae bacterium]MBV9308415.1 hypothetical protein [Acidobacteriaceae bacterium]MBV9679520.1 hypothetical protein [Acidobacteriaceae bacterium]MBV9939572.1 hypothetical protein [Acidobacteriaceae bacterium]
MKVVFTGAILCLIFLTCVTGVLSLHREVRKDFEMPAYMGAVPNHVQSAILHQVPLGSTKQEVDRYLQSRGVGQDGNSTCRWREQEGQLNCVIGTHPPAWNLVREICLLSFVFDSDHKLRDVQVRSRLGGPNLSLE